ncbi:outer dynein arm light chain 8 [Reticulomyxa filosa]|uniref:Outer dynein arm light chain 8 n=1 Tax=Reticulomyxa filosa TaxID=46433 RepID=X6NVT3_RETFI|nr:outer dynein arm light chain 8 [Reticulomyxa filosa]|eukprot:ETO30131.1 outer dynein arm light chain 8 [Reticulomyxa filosa]
MASEARKAVIKIADMAEEMQLEAVDVATQALDKFSIEKDVAAYIKKEFDKKHNPTWHCIVGRNFGSYVTHETKHFIYFYLGQVAKKQQTSDPYFKMMNISEFELYIFNFHILKILNLLNQSKKYKVFHILGFAKYLTKTSKKVKEQEASKHLDDINPKITKKSIKNHQTICGHRFNISYCKIKIWQSKKKKLKNGLEQAEGKKQQNKNPNLNKTQKNRKYKPSNIPFVCRQNIEIYLNGHFFYLFNFFFLNHFVNGSNEKTSHRDLYDGQRPKANFIFFWSHPFKKKKKVIDNIFALSAASRNIPSFKGPYIGVKFADKNERNFSKEVLAKSKSAVPLLSKGDKEQKTENFDSYGIIKGLVLFVLDITFFFCKKKKTHRKDMEKHSGGMSKWDNGSLANDTSSKHDSYGVVKVKGLEKHTGAQSKWEKGAIATNISSEHDSYGIVKVKGLEKHSEAQSKWEKGSLPVDTTAQHDSYGIIKVKGVEKHTGVQNIWETGSIPTDVSNKQDSYGIVKQ